MSKNLYIWKLQPIKNSLWSADLTANPYGGMQCLITDPIRCVTPNLGRSVKENLVEKFKRNQCPV